jgi:DEAD/DEAH box helicase domain-containing protein
VRQADCDYYTTAITYTKVTILDTFDDRPKAQGPGPQEDQNGVQVSAWALGLGSGACSHGEVHVVSRVVGFKKIKFYTNENVGSGELDLPEQQMHTTSYWMTIPADLLGRLPYAAADCRDGVVGLAFAMRNVAPLLLMCDSHDLGLSIDGIALEGASRVGGSTKGASQAPLSAAPTIFIYDNYPGGIGFSEPLFAMHETLLGQTRDLIEGCPCESGCPSCVGPEGATGPLAKAVALDLLRRLAESAPSALPAA